MPSVAKHLVLHNMNIRRQVFTCIIIYTVRDKKKTAFTVRKMKSAKANANSIICYQRWAVKTTPGFNQWF